MHKDEIEIVTVKEVKFYDSEDVDKSILDWAGYPILLSPKVMKEEYRNEYDRLPEGAKHLKEFGIYVFKC